MATLMETAAYSPNGEYLAFSSSDGRLKILETSTGILKQEYTPSSHLSATCTCLAWNSSNRSFNSPKKKRKKFQNDHLDSSLKPDLVALGTASGTVLLYSFLQGDLYTQLENGHNDTVNDVCWDSNSNSLFSCSSDQYIVHWDVTLSKVKHKWKADRHEIYSICLIDENNLLSASGCIKWWNISTREVIKKFTGHATEVFRLLPVLFNGHAEAEGTYFLTAAKNDRLISAWQLQENNDSNALACFAAVEELVQLDVSRNSRRDQPVYMTALTQGGTLHVFEHQLNGKCKKPIMPKVTINITTDGANGKTAKRLPVLAAHVLPSMDEPHILLAYGSFLSATFEEITLKDCQSEEWLIRDDPAAVYSTSMQDKFTKVKKPERPSSAKVLAPGHMIPTTQPQPEKSISLRKRKDSNARETELPMEERLNALQLAEPGNEKVRVPTADILVHLLRQGLHSGNLQLLDSVLHRNEENTIRNTVRRLTVTDIIPLITELHKRLHGRSTSSYQQWLKCILITHSSYLRTCPDAVDLLRSIAELFESRIELYPQMLQVGGRLSCMLALASSREESVDAHREALLVYNESSEDEEHIEDIMGSLSDSEENWSDLDMDLNESQTNHIDSSSEEEDD